MDIERYKLEEDRHHHGDFAIHHLNTYLARSKPKSTRSHVHSFYQIIWFTKGVGEHYVDFKSHPVRPGTVFFIAKDQIHRFDQAASYDGLLIHFNESFLVQNAPDIEIVLKYNTFNNQHSLPFVCIPKASEPLLRTLTMQMKMELQEAPSFGSRELLIHLLKAFLILIERQHRQSLAAQTDYRVRNEKHLQFLKFRELLEANFRNGMSVSQYADLLHLSTKRLGELTNEVAHKPPSQLINERVVLEAKRMLAHSGQRVTIIANALGFDDPSYFSKYFKKHAGQTPAQFRKETT